MTANTPVNEQNPGSEPTKATLRRGRPNPPTHSSAENLRGDIKKMLFLKQKQEMKMNCGMLKNLGAEQRLKGGFPP